jgi:hypothetical protein
LGKSAVKLILYESKPLSVTPKVFLEKMVQDRLSLLCVLEVFHPMIAASAGHALVTIWTPRQVRPREEIGNGIAWVRTPG